MLYLSYSPRLFYFNNWMSYFGLLIPHISIQSRKLVYRKVGQRLTIIFLISQNLFFISNSKPYYHFYKKFEPRCLKSQIKCQKYTLRCIQLMEYQSNAVDFFIKIYYNTVNVNIVNSVKIICNFQIAYCILSNYWW